MAKKDYGKIWADKIKVLFFSIIFISIANWIYGIRTGADVIYKPWEVFPALFYMASIIVAGSAVHDLVEQVIPIKLPVILYNALITSILSFSFTGWFATTMATEFAKVKLFPICTVVLAYAAVSIGKDLNTFKKQGVGIVITTLVAFCGTWIGSAVIAEIVLRFTGQV